MKCKHCGFVANDHPQRQSGSMNFHARNQHAEELAGVGGKFRELFEESEEKPPKKPEPKKRNRQRSTGSTSANWRLLNKSDPMEAAAIAKGYSEVNEVAGKPKNTWKVR